MKFKEVKAVTFLKVQDLSEPFEGVYLGSQEGDFGKKDYRFTSNGKEFVIFGTSSLKSRLRNIEPGFAVIIKYKGLRDLGDDRSFHEVSVEVSEEPADFDISQFLSPDQIEEIINMRQKK